MEAISESINNLIIKTSGGILFIWFAILLYSKKALEWCGRKIAEGANKDLVEKLMPSIVRYVEEKIKEFKDDTINTLSNELNEVKKSVETYKAKKHNIETENKYLKQIIKEDDQELVKIIQEYLNEKE
jgi:hypothetical protein